MSVTPADVAKIAALARLELEEQEVGRLTTELNGILQHVDQLTSLGRAETSDLTLRGRDSLSSTRPQAAEVPDALDLPPASFAPDWRQNFFVVPPPPGMHREDAE